MGALCLILVLAYFQLQSVHGAETVSGLGVNWGTHAYHPMDPELVVAMLKDNGIKKAKLFDSDDFVISAFSGTDIEVMVAIPNGELTRFATSSKDAEDYVKNNITKHVKNNVNIRYIAVGNEPFLTAYNGSYTNTTFPAMQNVQKAINSAGYADQIKVTTPINGDVYTSAPTFKPSDGDFRPDIKDLMKQICKFLQDHNSPFVVNIYPFFNVYQNPVYFPLEFAFFDGKIAPTVDKSITYYNVFDANVDTLSTALKKNGFSAVRIVVGEIGWPTDGDQYATVNNAKRFYQGLLKEMGSKKGTPLRPGPMEVYMFGLFDENLKNIDPGNFERHWGVFHHDGKPKFPLDLSGKGQTDKWPVSAKNVRYQDRKWCVLKDGVTDSSLIQKELDYACKGADCTSLGKDSSCGKLTLAGNASYAFNNWYQTRNQSADACGFNNLATLVTKDPSQGSCVFRIELAETIPSADGSGSGSGKGKGGASSAEMLTAMKSLLIGLTSFLLYVTFA